MKKKRRIIALLLTVCMLCSMLISPSYAVGTISATDDPSNGNSTDENTESDIDLPDIIKDSEFDNSGYVGRITENEPDLNTFVFDNGDGTYTMKVYSHPVKFIDADGEIKDITTDIKAVSGGFQTADNNIITTFSQKITDGITLECDDIEIKMIPAVSSLTTASVNAANAALSSDGKSVNYLIDSKTSYEYELTYMGFKEDIVVNEYTGQTEYSFILYTNGLSPVEIGGSWFMEDADGSVKATVGDIIIFTADERNNTFGSMSWQTVKEDQIYAMTIHVDAEYLSDPATVYPIRIDPTIEINYENDGTGAIEDIVVNSEDPHLGSETYLKIGTHPDDNSTSRALMRFPNLDIEGFRITSSYIFLRDLLCEGTQTPIECHEYIGAEWTESAGINWSGVPSTAIGALSDTLTVTYGNGNAGDGAINAYHFDITDLAVKWSSGAADPAKGVIFKATDAFENGTDKYYKTFASYNRANHKPYLSLKFEIDFSLDANWMPQGSTLTFNVCNFTPESMYDISNDNFIWESSNDAFSIISPGVVASPVNGGVTILTVTHSITNTSIEFRITSGLFKEEICYIENVGTNRYIDIEGPSKYVGAFIQQWDFHKGDQAKWRIQYSDEYDGYFYLISEYSGLYLGVDSNNTSIVKQLSSVDDHTLWKLEKTLRGTYKIICKATEQMGAVLAVPANYNSLGTNLTQVIYFNNGTYKNEWYIHVIKDASLLAVPENYDRSSFFPEALDHLSTIGYVNNYYNNGQNDYDTTEAELLERMKFSKITLIRTHGSGECIQASDQYLMSDDLLSLPSSTLEFADLIIYGACLTAEGGKYADNFVNATVATGARTVIGFENSVSSSACNAWCLAFFKYYSQYYNDAEKGYTDVCVSTDSELQDHPFYEYTNNDGILVTLRNYVIAGEQSFPD